tara:strand:+ start:91 stop:492 length:402 start_codon:yes stop_codon:yes gene_type:complete
MEISSKHYGTSQHKNMIKKSWKKRGVDMTNFEDVYEVYINKTCCDHCKNIFKNTKDRQLDHNHNTGKIRNIICQKCNHNDTYINYPYGVTKELIKEKIKEKNKEKIYCDCGCIISRCSSSRHKQSNRHLSRLS